MEVHNWNLQVGDICLEAIASSSVLLIGDNDYFILSSFYDTPPESYIVGPLVPLGPIGGT